jgi:hypothetical protein
MLCELWSAPRHYIGGGVWTAFSSFVVAWAILKDLDYI